MFKKQTTRQRKKKSTALLLFIEKCEQTEAVPGRSISNFNIGNSNSWSKSCAMKADENEMRQIGYNNNPFVGKACSLPL